MKFNSSLVKPKIKTKSDKYSWNLYRAFEMAEKEMAKFPSLDFRIYWHELSVADDSIVKFDPEKSLKPSHLYLMRIYPYNQGMSGRRISDILGLRPNEKIETFCYDLIVKQKHLVDITEWFWNEYVSSGRCLFNREHDDNYWWLGAETRYTQINKNSRKCNWCGEHQRRRIEKEVKIERVEVWDLQTV
jgi:hypothetical protein